jgi:hypothetical protein
MAAVTPVAAYGGATWSADPSAAPTGAYGSSVVPGGWVPAQGYATPASPGWSTRKRVLVVGAAVLAGLVVLAGLGGLARLGESRTLASGPPLTLSDAAPPTVVSRTVASTPESAEARAKMTPLITDAFAGLPGSSPSHLEIYGPGGRSAPVRGNGYVVLVWMRVAKPFDQNAFATGMVRGLTKASAGATSQTFTEPNGGKTVCSLSTPTELEVPMVQCAWIRSGTGLVVTIEYDVALDVVLADNRGVVATMAHPS